MSQPELNSEVIFRKSVAKPVLFSILILVSGIIIGSGMTLIISEKLENKLTPKTWEHMSNRMIQHMIRELRLSPEQRDQIKPIIQKHMKAMDVIRRDVYPKISEELEQMNEGIMAVLDERQQQIWQDKSRRMRDLHRMREHRGPGGGRRGGHRPGDGPDGPRPRRQFEHRHRPEDMKPPEVPGPGDPEEIAPIPEEPPTE